MLRIGKLKESVFQRSVKKQLHNVEKSAPYFTQTVSVEGWTLAPERIVYNMVNAFTAVGGEVKQISLAITMPEGTEEPQLRACIATIGKLCETNRIFLEVSEGRVSPQVKKVLFYAVGMGTYVEKDAKRVIRPGMDVIVAGSIACEGAALIARDREEELKKRFAGFYVDTAKKMFDVAAMPQAKEVFLKDAVWGSMVREGGIFAGLWEMAAAGKVGLDIHLGEIPIRQHTIEVCEFFNLNPYMLLSGGCLLLVTDHGQSVISKFFDMGISAAVIGRTTEGNDRLIRYDDETRYLEPPKTDEIYHMISE